MSKLQFRVVIDGVSQAGLGLYVLDQDGATVATTSDGSLAPLGGGWYTTTEDVDTCKFTVKRISDDTAVTGLDGRSHVAVDADGDVTTKTADKVLAATSTVFSSASNPGTGKYAGQMVFDTTNGWPCWWNGHEWQKADGTVVWNK